MKATFAIVRAFLGKLPPWVWATMAAIGIILIAYAKGYDTARDKYRRQMAELTASVEAAQEQARAAQNAVNQAEQERLDAVTKEADHAHEVTRVVVRDATDRFIADNGMRPDNQCVASGTDSAAADTGAGSAQDVSAVPVLVEASDVRLFGEWVAYGMTCNQFVNGLAGK